MKKEVGVLIAGAAGLAIALGWIGFRKLLKNKNCRYSEEYNDYHRLFHHDEDDAYDVEYYAMK